MMLPLSSSRYAQEADRLIKKLHQITAENYRLDIFSANMHSLNHLSWQVTNFGLLWFTSAIMFESANHLLKANISGTVNHLSLIRGTSIGLTRVGSRVLIYKSFVRVNPKRAFHLSSRASR